MDNLEKQKTEMRQRILALRNELPPAVHANSSIAIVFALQRLPAYQKAASVLAYMNFGTEVDIRAFVTAVLSDDKMLVLPRVDPIKNCLVLHQVTSLNQVTPDKGCIREPFKDLPVRTLDNIDFALLPGVAFDRKLNRLGYGKGFYDRLFERTKQPPLRVAAAFSCQLVDSVPISTTDIPIDILVTESKIIERKV